MDDDLAYLVAYILYRVYFSNEYSSHNGEYGSALYWVYCTKH